MSTDELYIIKARALYPEMKEGLLCHELSDYTPIINSLGTVLVRVDVKDWKGDTYSLLRGEGGRYGVSIIGWGSCSGCDALMACTEYSDLAALIQQIENGVRWFDSLQDAATWVRSEYRRLEFYNGEDFSEFACDVENLL